MRKGRVWLSLLAALGLLASAACSNARMIEPGEPARLIDAGGGIETLVFWHTYSDVETRVFEERVVPMFEAAHPNIRIESVRQPYNAQLKSVLLARASSNKPPDVIRMDIAWTPEYVQLGLAKPIGGLPGFDAIRESLHEAAMETNAYDGDYYGLPLNVNTKAAVYNRELLERAGFSAASPPSSLSELLDAAEAHGLKIGMAEFSLWGSLPYLYGLGGRLMNDEYTRATGYLDSDATVAAATRLKELYLKGVMNPNLIYGRVDLWDAIFGEGYVMIDEGPWFFTIKLNSGDRAKVEERLLPAPFPVSDGFGSVIGGENLVISKGTKHPEAAWTFLAWMVSPEAQRFVAEMGLIPTNLEVLGSPEFEEGREFKQAYIEGLANAFYRPLIANTDAVEAVFEEYMIRAFEEEADVRATLREAAIRIDELLR
ncbi:extracellular solute-binding protein [Paenibacillus sp.]|uniref:extracellular solute-binding protein n=1 Tax=Paenibacillus sp. TaxID=58172 RepID=UPI002810ACB9|nr:extracellular solute-binding protein [Paenibacillus sp.]